MLLLNTLQQFDIPLVDFLTILATIGLLLFFLLASLCTPLLGVITEAIYTAKRKAFHDKCAMQITQAGFAVALLVFIVIGFSVSTIMVQNQPELFEPPLLWRTAACFAGPAAALFSLMLYLVTWKPLKTLRALHLTLGIITALSALGLLCGGFLLLGLVSQPLLTSQLWTAPLIVAKALLQDFLASPSLWLMLGYLFCTGMSCGGGLVQIWLIMRRNRADYGRDYYAFAMRYCARFALTFVLLATGLASGIFWELRHSIPLEFSQPMDPGILLMAGGLPLCCALLWLAIGKSDTPLRHKPGSFFACLFLFIALCAQLLMLVSTFPMA